MLGPIALTALGVGAIIGAGIFVMTGRVAAVDAGPAIMISFTVAALGCAFAALCYSEFAAMAPVAGSAYTYAYATLGEVFAWIIGWDLMLEYAMSCGTVAAAWSHYLNAFLVAFTPYFMGEAYQISNTLVTDPVHGLRRLLQSARGADDAGHHDRAGPRNSRKRADQRHSGAGQTGGGAARDRAGLLLHPAEELDLDPGLRAIDA